jgi:sulfide:quinone oxidoreductase
MPMGVPIPPSPAASEALLVAFAERQISWHPDRLVRGLDPVRNVARFSEGDEMPYDLFLGVPVHRVPAVVHESGLCADGWIPVNPRTLETAFPGVYAVGDVTSVGTPKAGVFAEGQAAVVADAIIAQVRNRESSVTYDGRGLCYLEFGDDQVARVDVTFMAGQSPTGTFDGPSEVLAADKSAFGSSRIQRWFNRQWTSY